MTNLQGINQFLIQDQQKASGGVHPELSVDKQHMAFLESLGQANKALMGLVGEGESFSDGALNEKSILKSDAPLVAKPIEEDIILKEEIAKSVPRLVRDGFEEKSVVKFFKPLFQYQSAQKGRSQSIGREKISNLSEEGVILKEKNGDATTGLVQKFLHHIPRNKKVMSYRGIDGVTVQEGKDSVSAPLEKNNFLRQEIIKRFQDRSGALGKKDATSFKQFSHQEFSEDGSPVVKVKDFILETSHPSSMDLFKVSQQKLGSKLFPMDSIVDQNFHKLDSSQLIEKISDYIIQKSMGNMKKIDFNVNHAEIGGFRITASQDVGQQGIQLYVTTFAREGADFFGTHQGRLLSLLSQKGIHVQDFKLDHQFSGDLNNQNFYAENSREERSSHREDSNRRRELWKQFVNREFV